MATSLLSEILGLTSKEQHSRPLRNLTELEERRECRSEVATFAKEYISNLTPVLKMKFSK